MFFDVAENTFWLYCSICENQFYYISVVCFWVQMGFQLNGKACLQAGTLSENFPKCSRALGIICCILMLEQLLAGQKC